MKLSWLNFRVGLGLSVVAIFAAVFSQGGGVREIHRESDLVNFPLVEPRPHADDWPAWRGPDHRNVSQSTRFPKQWSKQETNSWNLELPGKGQSTPVVWGEQVFLLMAEEETQRVSLRCYHRSTGRELWWTPLHEIAKARAGATKVDFSSTPVCDGQFVYVATPLRGSLWITSIDLSGKIAWQQPAGPYSARSGYTASPVIHQSLVIVTANQRKDSYLAALHRQTGEIIWRVKQPEGETSSSPVVAFLSGQHQLLISGQQSICSYNPGNGQSLWTFRWRGDRAATSVAFDNEHVFATTRSPVEQVVCINASGTGDVTESHLVWSQMKTGSGHPAPAYHAGQLFVLSEEGILKCLEAATGKVEWRRQLAGNFSASPVIAGDCLICVSDAGHCFVIQMNAAGEILARNSIIGGTKATPVITGDSILVRSATALQRIRSSETEPVVEAPERKKRRM